MRPPKLWTCALVPLVALSASAGTARDRGPSPREGREARVLQAFDTMYGVDGPFIGDGFPIRGIIGDELPWEVREARGRLDADGHLTIRIRGLVFKDAIGVPPEIVGTNDEPTFRAAVSCWTEAGDHVDTINVITQGFPATRSGDSTIRATLELPNPCVAPIVLVLAGSEDKWFAVAGIETEEEGEGGDR